MSKRIYVMCNPGLDSFILPIVDYLRKYYDVHMFYGGSHQEFWDTINKADLVWFEWAEKWLQNATVGEKSAMKYLVRMHSYEIFTPLIAQINWNQIDGLIVPNHSLFDVINRIKSYDMEEQIRMAEQRKQKINLRLDMIPPNFIKDKIYVIPNPVDGKRFVRKDKQDNKKIAMVGHINHKKDPMTAFYAFMEILKYDPEFTLHIAGGFQEIRYRVKMDELIDNVNLKGKVFFYNVPEEHLPHFLEDKNYILSTSLFESFHYSIANGMASGLIPLVGGWTGCKNLYPSEYIFYSLSDCVDIVKRCQGGNLIEEGKKCRKWVMDRYMQEKIMPQFKMIVDRLLWEDEISEKANSGSKNIFSEMGIQHLNTDDIISHCKRMGKIKK